MIIYQVCMCNITNILAIVRYNHQRKIRFMRVYCVCAALSSSRCVLCAVHWTNVASSRLGLLCPAAPGLPSTQNNLYYLTYSLFLLFTYDFICFINYSWAFSIFTCPYLSFIKMFFIFTVFPRSVWWLSTVKLMASQCHVALT